MNKDKILYFLPRVLGILFIAFLSLFALDMFGGNKPLWEQIGGFLIHLIPNFILTLVLLIAWKKEKLGGILFILLSFVLAALTIASGNFLMISPLFLPLLLIGTLFLIQGYQPRK